MLRLLVPFGYLLLTLAIALLVVFAISLLPEEQLCVCTGTRLAN